MSLFSKKKITIVIFLLFSVFNSSASAVVNTTQGFGATYYANNTGGNTVDGFNITVNPVNVFETTSTAFYFGLSSLIDNSGNRYAEVTWTADNTDLSTFDLSSFQYENFGNEDFILKFTATSGGSPISHEVNSLGSQTINIDLSAQGFNDISSFTVRITLAGNDNLQNLEIKQLVIADLKVVTSKAQPTNHPTAFTATANSTSQITTAWTDATGTVIPDSYLLMCSTSSSFPDPVDNTAQTDDTNCADGAGVQNITQGTGTVAWTGLTAGTQYYYKIFPYTNTGADVDYKTDATVGTANATTTALQSSTTFDFESNVVGFGTKDIQHTVTGETLHITSIDKLLRSTGIGLPISGVESLNREVDSSNPQYSFSLVSGNTFDLTSITMLEIAGFSEIFDLTSSKGTISYSLPTAGNQVFDISSHASASNMQGITSFTLTGTSTTSPFSVILDDIILSNITAPATKAEPTNHPTNFTATVNSISQITTAWTDATGAVTPDSYLLMCSTTSNSLTAPVDTTAQTNDTDCSDGSGVQNVSQGTGTVVWTGLMAGTPYFYKIYPYSNTGTDVDYKTDATVGTANATTTSPPTAPTINGTNGTTITGTGEVGATVSVRNASSIVIGTAVVDVNGNWTMTANPVVANATVLTATQAHTVGNDSIASSPQTVDTINEDATLTSYSTVTEPVHLSSTANTKGEALRLFDFVFIDGGGGDGLHTIVSQIVLHTSGTADFSKVTWLLNGDNIDKTGVYSSSTNTLTFSDLGIAIPDGRSVAYTVLGYHHLPATGLINKQTYILSIDGDVDLTLSASGTQMSGTNTPVNNGTGTQVDITATKLKFETLPSN